MQYLAQHHRAPHNTVATEYAPIKRMPLKYQSEYQLEQEFIHSLETNSYEHLTITHIVPIRQPSSVIKYMVYNSNIG